MLLSLNEGNSALNAAARNTDVELMVTGPVYNVDPTAGSEPSVVYLICAEASGHVIVTLMAPG